ncbi:MAG TPA: type III pantothenate kinase [Actinomycetota bacterium]|nr:type III pantothenate kinase [Actinomycetota bacterium]
MLLAVDVGNTETMLGVFRGQDLLRTWRMATDPDRTPDEFSLLFGGFLGQEGLSFSKEITGVVLSSVVPASTQALREMTEAAFGFPALVLEPGIRTGIAILIDNPREVGADRIANAIAAHARYGGPCIVVDFGTATNFDVVTERGEYLGGVLAPGLQVAAEALYRAAAKLTPVELRAPTRVIGRGTAEALRSGLVFGAAAAVDGLVDRIRDELGSPAEVVATGGLAPVVVPHCRTVDHHDPWLTLEGLRLVFERNAGPRDA